MRFSLLKNPREVRAHCIDWNTEHIGNSNWAHSFSNHCSNARFGASQIKHFAEYFNGYRVLRDLFSNENYFDDAAALPKFLIDLAMNRNILKDDTTLIMLKKR